MDQPINGQTNIMQSFQLLPKKAENHQAHHQAEVGQDLVSFVSTIKQLCQLFLSHVKLNLSQGDGVRELW